MLKGSNCSKKGRKAIFKHTIQISNCFLTDDSEGRWDFMDIERVNENTLKLFISYHDIEDRGYTREEIWYNRAKGEQLFWDMIEEVNTEDYFDVEGPIWIHINASEVGLEVVVTRAQMLKDNDYAEDNQDLDEQRNMFSPFDEASEDLLNQLRQFDQTDESESMEDLDIFVFKFKDIDDLIPVAKRYVNKGLKSTLYKYEEYYYLVVDFEGMDAGINRLDVIAEAREFLTRSQMTIHRLQEYGEMIMQDNCFETVCKYFV